MASNKQHSFEKNLSTLESLVEKLEHGDLPLEQALKEFESGVKLVRECQKALQAAEQKIAILTQKTNDAEPTTFQMEDKEDRDE